jgi:hypothetical protein
MGNVGKIKERNSLKAGNFAQDLVVIIKFKLQDCGHSGLCIQII